jgi:ABC-type uncharacterized transport system permease subunit
MEISIGLLKVLVPIAYLATLAAYAGLFFSVDEARYSGKAKAGLVLSLLLNTALLLVLGYHFNRCPLGTYGEGLLFIAWILGVIHFLSEWLADTRRLGFFTLLPIALCAVAASFLLKPDYAFPPEFRGSLLVFHVIASLAAYACFVMAAILAVMYVTLDRKLKHKSFDITFRKLPPLEKLDKLSANWSFLGSATMVVSSVIGIVWVRKTGLAGMTYRELGIYLVLAVFVGAAASRKLFGMRGRRHAFTILIGFVILLLTNFLGTHGFQG